MAIQDDFAAKLTEISQVVDQVLAHVGDLKGLETIIQTAITDIENVKQKLQGVLPPAPTPPA